MSAIDHVEFKRQRQRQRHAHAAMRLTGTLGPDRAAEAFEAILSAYAVALAAVTSRDNAVKVFGAAMAQFAPVKSTPRLVVNNNEVA